MKRKFRYRFIWCYFPVHALGIPITNQMNNLVVVVNCHTCTTCGAY